MYTILKKWKSTLFSPLDLSRHCSRPSLWRKNALPGAFTPMPTSVPVPKRTSKPRARNFPGRKTSTFMKAIPTPTHAKLITTSYPTAPQMNTHVRDYRRISSGIRPRPCPFPAGGTKNDPKETSARDFLHNVSNTDAGPHPCRA